MKIAIVLNKSNGQVTITWPNDEQHTYFASAQTSSDPRDHGYEMVEHEIRDAVADTMQDLLKCKLLRMAGWSVPDGRPAEYAMRVQRDQPYSFIDAQMRGFTNSPSMHDADVWETRDRFVREAAEQLAKGNVVHLTRGGEHVQTYYPGQFTSRRRLFNEGAGDVAMGAGDLQLEGAGDLQLRPSASVIPTEIRHLPPTQDGEAWEVTYSDGRSEILRDACQVRSLAEYIYKPA